MFHIRLCSVRSEPTVIEPDAPWAVYSKNGRDGRTCACKGLPHWFPKPDRCYLRSYASIKFTDTYLFASVPVLPFTGLGGEDVYNSILGSAVRCSLRAEKRPLFHLTTGVFLELLSKWSRMVELNNRLTLPTRVDYHYQNSRKWGAMLDSNQPRQRHRLSC